MEKIVLIVAGGSGSRMKTRVPKQFLLLKGLPVLMHTVQKFYHFDNSMRIIVVLPADQTDTWNNLCLKFRFHIKHEVGTGGETRFHSVQRNLAGISDHCLIAVHDGVRPLVSHETIERCFESALKYGNAVPCVEIPETMRYLDKAGNSQADRTMFRLIQTPQVFEGSILKRAYGQEYQAGFTDDAGVVESLGYSIHLVEGNPENIKITLKKDMKIAACFL